MKLHTKLIVAALACGATIAQASTITIGMGASSAAAQSSAAAYQTVVSAAIANTAVVDSYDNIVPQNLGLGTSSGNFAFQSIVNFGVSTSQAGLWSIRSGVDFGKGGALFVDGVAQAFNSNDMWWGGSYSDTSQYFGISLNLAAGNHTLAIYGLEDCCSGAQQAQFAYGSTAFTSFSKNDGLNPVTAVPEPESYAMLLTGLGLMAAIARRRNNTR